MKTPPLSDTSPAAERLQIELMRQAPAWRKAYLAGQMTESVRLLALSGLRQRHPEATPAELRRLLADLWLGPELAARVDALPLEKPKMVPEPITVTLQVTDALETSGVNYFIGGSLASAIYGISRATMDVDIIADLRPEQIETFTALLGSAFYVDEEMIQAAVQHQSSFNLIHRETLLKVDIFIHKTRPYDQEQFARRVHQVLSAELDHFAYVASAEDTILSKLEWYRMGGEVSERQWRDVQSILKVQGNRLDQAYLRHWAAQLGISDLLERAIAESR
jgi:hypothetical protein